ncbi:MAG: CoA activase [Deltaproteobacteria bacterium]|nr:MAG: CoA activase [Deltaproteobacteria bacterium]
MDQFESLKAKVGKFSLANKTILVPEMGRSSSSLVAASMRSFGIDAQVMETYKGLQLGKQYTSGKECFPCQITLGDVLHHLEREKELLGESFNPENYLYFMAESGGPCRFGMYNKLHRIILDSMDGFSKTRIASLTAEDSYSIGGLMKPELRTHFRRTAYVAIVIADILDRMLWHTRPYEKEKGQAQAYYEKTLDNMCVAVEIHGSKKRFQRIYGILEEALGKAQDIVNPKIPPKPLIGMVGEIYLRSHTKSNQDLIKLLESYGGEVVNASIAEWVNYVSYDNMQKAKRKAILALRERDLKSLHQHLRNWLSNRIELTYQYLRMDQVYRRAKKHLQLYEDHKIDKLEKQLDNGRLFSFQVGTEAGLSIGGALEYCRHGFDGIVNVFPFTCMPSTMCSAVLKPLLDRMQVPYIDAAYDGTYQPNLEAIVRTFMYQAAQHQKKRLAQGNTRH